MPALAGAPKRGNPFVDSMPKARKSGRFAPLAAAILLMDPPHCRGQPLIARFEPQKRGFLGVLPIRQVTAVPVSGCPAKAAAKARKSRCRRAIPRPAKGQTPSHK